MAGRKNKHIGSNLDDFLKEEGVLEEFEAAAIKKAIAWQIAKQMKVLHISTVLMAKRKTSRTQVSRLLDPDDGNVTIEMLQKAATALGRKLHVELA